MRKILIIFLTILLLLVSCATKEVKQDEPEMEVVEATVVETPAPVTPEPALEPELPQEEPLPEPEPEVVDFEPVVEEPVAEQEVTEIEPVVEEPVKEQPEEEDWSKVITAEAPVEQPVAEEPEAKVTVEEPKPAEEKAPATKTPATSTAPASAKKPSFVDKVTDSLKKIGQFIMREKLLSIGFLTCIIGVIYLIIALVKSRRPRDRFDSYERPEQPYYEDQEPEVVEEKTAPKRHDTEPEDEDDEFLRSLLGDDKY